MIQATEKEWGMMEREGVRKIVILLLALCLALPLFWAGCGKSEWSSEAGKTENHSQEETRTSESPGGSGNALATRSKIVHMCGRSVLAGWFEHWGWDWDPDHPVYLSGFRLYYHELQTPPYIVDSALPVIKRVSDGVGGIIFFKLCFDDFEGGDEYSARENLRRNQAYIQSVVRAVVDERGLPLILGNALPKVQGYTDQWLVWNQREYNRFLTEMERNHKGKVRVLDIYGALATPGGWLRAEYATNAEDSHANGAAYTQLDRLLEGILSDIVSI